MGKTCICSAGKIECDSYLSRTIYGKNIGGRCGCDYQTIYWSSVEGSYLVHRFSDMEYVGTIADYYLEKSDNRAKSRSLMNKAATLSKIISFMDVSNGGGPFVDTPNFPYVAVIFNCLSALQPLVEHQREKMLEEAAYYQNKPDEYELKYVRIINHVGPFQIGKVMIYV